MVVLNEVKRLLESFFVVASEVLFEHLEIVEIQQVVELVTQLRGVVFVLLGPVGRVLLHLHLVHLLANHEGVDRTFEKVGEEQLGVPNCRQFVFTGIKELHVRNQVLNCVYEFEKVSVRVVVVRRN